MAVRSPFCCNVKWRPPLGQKCVYTTLVRSLFLSLSSSGWPFSVVRMGYKQNTQRMSLKQQSKGLCTPSIVQAPVWMGDRYRAQLWGIEHMGMIVRTEAGRENSMLVVNAWSEERLMKSIMPLSSNRFVGRFICEEEEFILTDRLLPNGIQLEWSSNTLWDGDDCCSNTSITQCQSESRRLHILGCLLSPPTSSCKELWLIWFAPT